MDLDGYFRDTGRALAFLTRLPVPAVAFEGRPSSLSQQSATFPVAGAIAALPSALLFGLLLGAGCNGLLTALLAVVLQIAISGALHEDGLADCADGLGGGGDREQRLSIMKDSRVGTYGVIALIVSIGLRVAALAAIGTVLTAFATALVLPVVAALSRAAMVWHWHALASARPPGAGVAAGAGVPDKDATLAAVAVAALMAVASMVLALPFHGLIVAILATVAATFAFTSRVRSLLDGHTGDTIGGCQQVAEVAALACLALVV
ncbi:adenosylcobinamide-GDP ribazoletransferase [Rhizobium halophytocola]|uniref:Adenosylcobinamide-GDP ribazoletransferase n=1 Tax=Rhizobium halophytocola TaxID=735519 RepID=A0ABS4DZ15_9HYPH|nr:adenosylcobinamide-GDP ribazoletransferase [Rhizobium halophytocola]MBP1850934.1 adenosylcobinamide-GDP ribazoletransferase [Rhizobium halophytocola]